MSRELLKEARNWIHTILSIYPVVLGARQDGTTLITKIDAYLAAPSESAMEVVRKIREEGKYNDAYGKKEPANTFKPKVPRKVFEIIYLRAMRRYEQEGYEGAKQLRDSDIAEITKFNGVEVE